MIRMEEVAGREWNVSQQLLLLIWAYQHLGMQNPSQISIVTEVCSPNPPPPLNFEFLHRDHIPVIYRKHFVYQQRLGERASSLMVLP
jgi:hypothetical protein